jgi:hypothetical protein
VSEREKGGDDVFLRRISVLTLCGGGGGCVVVVGKGGGRGRESGPLFIEAHCSLCFHRDFAACIWRIRSTAKRNKSMVSLRGR